MTLQNNTFPGLFIGHNLVTLPNVDSTNNFLKQALANSTPLIEGTVIMAVSQHAGRGQQQNKWNSEPGKNLTFSILLKPTFVPVVEQFKLTLAIGVGILKALKKILGTDVKIKWPNDVYFQDGKIGGVLIENMVTGLQIKNAVVGIGLNVNQLNFPDWVPNAISVKQILQQDYDLKLLLSEICGSIEAAYLTLKAGRAQQLKELYLENLYWIGKPGLFKDKHGEFTGTIAGVNNNGQLIVKINGGERLYNFKEIEFLNKPPK